MGLVRFLLAVAVAYGHSAGVAPTTLCAFINPYYAVQAFFVISGFYMALIYKKYSGIWQVFYLNRYLRLIVSFWVVAIITYLFSLLRQESKLPVLGFYDMPILAVFSNLFLIGSDWLQFFVQNGKDMTGWLLVPQSWSLGTEITFYLLVPFLVSRNTKVIIGIIVVSIIIRFIIIGCALPFFPWQQRFFPAEIVFFLIGILSYRMCVWMKLRGWNKFSIFGFASLAAGCSIIAFIGHIPGSHVVSAWGSLLLAGILLFILPFIFLLTQSSKVDFWLGQLSYPIYLWHVFVIMYLFSPGQYFGEKVVGVSLLLSLLMVFVVDRPLERWRQARVSSARLQSQPAGLLYETTYRG